jgi:hypothetical protein
LSGSNHTVIAVPAAAVARQLGVLIDELVMANRNGKLVVRIREGSLATRGFDTFSALFGYLRRRRCCTSRCIAPGAFTAAVLLAGPPPSVPEWASAGVEGAEHAARALECGRTG